jgi:hypothetical protein
MLGSLEVSTQLLDRCAFRRPMASCRSPRSIRLWRRNTCIGLWPGHYDAEVIDPGPSRLGDEGMAQIVERGVGNSGVLAGALEGHGYRCRHVGLASHRMQKYPWSGQAPPDPPEQGSQGLIQIGAVDASLLEESHRVPPMSQAA